MIQDRFETPEALVKAIRAAASPWQPSLEGMLTQELFGRELPSGVVTGGFCEPIIRRVAQRFSLDRDRDRLREFRRRCHEKLWQAIHAGSEAQPFWEQRFGLALCRLALNEARGLIRERQHDRIDDIAERYLGFGFRESSVPQWRHLRIAEIKRCIEMLPEKQRTAFKLHVLEGYPIESADPQTETVARLMRVTGRMVRNYLGEAGSRLRWCLRG